MLTNDQMRDILVQLISGGFAGAIATASTYPITNIRMRLISADLEKISKNKDKKIEEKKIEVPEVTEINNSLDESKKEIPELNLKKEGNHLMPTLEELQQQNINIYQNECNKEEIKNENKEENKEASKDIEGGVLKIYKSKTKLFLEYMLDHIEFLKFTLSLIKNEGFLSLFNGLPSAMILAIVQNGCFFCMQKFFTLSYQNMAINVRGNSLIISFLAAVITSIMINPVGGKNNFEMIRHIYKEDGFAGFFKGLVPSLLLTLNPIVQFALYEALKTFQTNELGEVTSKAIAIAGMLSKLVSTVVIYPLLSIKTLYQARNKSDSGVSTLTVVMEILKKEGIGGLFKGFTAKVITAMVNNVVLMLCYEKIQKIVQDVIVKLFPSIDVLHSVIEPLK